MIETKIIIRPTERIAKNVYSLFRNPNDKAATRMPIPNKNLLLGTNSLASPRKYLIDSKIKRQL
jgi:hypothetical protein